MVLKKLSPAFLGRDKDLEQFQALLDKVGDSNPHFRNLLANERLILSRIIE